MPVGRIRCHGCGRRVAADARECGRCGTALVVLCGCGVTLPARESTCPSCGCAHQPQEYAPTWTPRRIVFMAALATVHAAVAALVVTERMRSTPTRDLEAADAAFRQEAWNEAEVLYARHVADHGEPAAVRHLPALALHNMRRFDDAERTMREADDFEREMAAMDDDA